MISRLASRFRFDTPAGKVIRFPLALVPNNRVVSILSGINKRMRWVTGTGPSRACWLGSYEAEHLAALSRIVQPGMVAYDLGANAGYYTLALSRLVGGSGHVYAFEPEAGNAQALHRHVELNRLSNVTIVQTAVSDHTGMVAFSGSGSSGSIGLAGKYLVPSVTLDEFLAHGYPAPDFIKMDIEGAEMDALKGATNVLQKHPIVCLASHTADLHDGCAYLLRSAGYRLAAFDGGSIDHSADFLAFPSLA